MGEMSGSSGVHTSNLGGSLLEITPSAPGAETELTAWAAKHTSAIEDGLLTHGAILFRGFGVDDVPDFERFARTISRDFPDFSEESSPRSRVKGVVQTSTDYPAQYPIQFHNEFSYGRFWPMRIYFCCRTAPSRGGQTPLADSRKVLQNLSDTTRQRFERNGVLYKRTFREDLGVSWQTVFRTTEKAVVETRCAELGMDFRWTDADGLLTSQVAAATAQHPSSGELVWFNHAYFFNVLSLEPAELRDVMLAEPEEARSTNTYYGDGSPIEPDTIDEIRNAYDAERIEFAWERGDVLLLDNMLTSHSRRSFVGERDIIAIMADACSRDDLPRP